MVLLWNTNEFCKMSKDKIRLFYQAGELSLKRQENAKAKEYFTKCIAINDNSTWKGICQQNLDLLIAQ